MADKPLKAGDAVLAVDVQNDFCPGGALAVPAGTAGIPGMNAWLRAATRPVFADQQAQCHRDLVGAGVIPHD